MNSFARLAFYVCAGFLNLYPRPFRMEFGDEMRMVLRAAIEAAASDGRKQVFRLCLREVADLPGALLQQYRQRSVWALSAAGSFPNESARLEARFRREFYRRQAFKALKAALLVVLFIAAVPVHGYLYTVYTIHQRAQEVGIYPSLDEAIQANIEEYDQYYRNFTFDGFTKGQERVDFIWYVIIRGHADSLADGTPINPRHKNRVEGGTFYVHTKDGWVRYGENFWIAFGFLADWMKFYHLYGEDN